MTTFRIIGRVINRLTQRPLAGLRLETWDKDLICDDLVGSAISDEHGTFQITFDDSYFRDLFFDRHPDLFFKVFRAGQLIHSTEDSVIWNVAAGETLVIIAVEETDDMTDTIRFTVGLNFDGVTEDNQPPPSVVYAFGSKGELLNSAPVEAGQSSLSLPATLAGQTVRLVFGPRVEGADPPTLASLKRVGAYEKRVRVDPQHPRLDLTLIQSIWIRWLLCPCVVRGRLIQRLTLPDGSIRELPLCHARVKIYEVDPWPIIIRRLPDPIIIRLRDEWLDIIRRPLPIPPEPISSLVESQAPLLQPLPSLRGETVVQASEVTRRLPSLEVKPLVVSQSESMALQLDLPTQNKIRAIASTPSLVQLREGLVDLADLIRPYICLWPWLHPFFWYRADYVRTVEVDEEGRFETILLYWCFGDKPDLYFKAEQLQGGVWQTIYEPSVPCHTYWNYACGTEVTLTVTDPSAVACMPDDPVDTDYTTWVMPFAVGGTKIWGTPPLAPAAPAGWVKTDGTTDYGGFVNAPFGGYLGFRHSYSDTIPGAIKYFRWSYRKGTSGQWKHMAIPVLRYYVKQSPGVLPSFPTYRLGPNTVGPNANLFEFRPLSPPPAEPGDPAGTTTYWPTDSALGDIYSGFLDTPTLSPNVAAAAGQYQIKLEVFDAAGNQVLPSAGAFQFIVPRGVAGDGVTILSRAAEASELDAGGFVFTLHIDNNKCTASLDLPAIGATSVADNCGFLRYDPTSPTGVTLGFHAQHPNQFAEFNFRVVRGSTFLSVASALDQEVAAIAAGAYTGDSNGNFSHTFGRSLLLCGPADPTSCCVNAAFAEHLYVFAKATTGWGHRISAYDAEALQAFALAPIGG